MSTIINLFGTVIRCWICEIPMHRYNQLKDVAVFHETTVDNILFDLEILKRLGYKHWKNIFAIEEINGFLIEPKNKVEIKNGTRIISKFTANEILGTESFFKLYTTQEVDFKIINRLDHKYLLM